LPHTIRRAFADDLNVFKCKPCGFSVTEPASWTAPVRLTTGQNVQGWFADDASTTEGRVVAADTAGRQQPQRGLKGIKRLPLSPVTGVADTALPGRSLKRPRSLIVGT
jgi:hypothetical protein